MLLAIPGQVVEITDQAPAGEGALPRICAETNEKGDPRVHELSVESVDVDDFPPPHPYARHCDS